MDEHKALNIVSALANGVNPLSGETLPPDNPCHSPEIVRALYVAIRALDSGASRRPRSRSAVAPNAGKPWSEDEDAQLLAGFDRGGAVAELARIHGRTAAGIQARLEKHGRVQPSVLGRPLQMLRATP